MLWFFIARKIWGFLIKSARIRILTINYYYYQWLPQKKLQKMFGEVMYFHT